MDRAGDGESNCRCDGHEYSMCERKGKREELEKDYAYRDVLPQKYLNNKI